MSEAPAFAASRTLVRAWARLAALSAPILSYRLARYNRYVYGGKANLTPTAPRRVSGAFSAMRSYRLVCKSRSLWTLLLEECGDEVGVGEDATADHYLYQLKGHLIGILWICCVISNQIDGPLADTTTNTVRYEDHVHACCAY